MHAIVRTLVGKGGQGEGMTDGRRIRDDDWPGWAAAVLDTFS